ncbi:RNA methyltransferase PUA domain-containing protein, partial [Kingella kingae]|uniref:RNA methyltransferase PUA domain-containing protein n=1 Tax=Kingella kingae TaxID=504 RepID=UPI0025573920
LRVRPNENITLFDGKGKAHTARLTVLEKRRAETEILHEETADTESPLNITLIQSISSGERMDFTLQQSV